MGELQFLFGSKFELEDTLSDFGTSIELIDGDIETEDNVDPFMFCSQGTLRSMKVRMT